MTDLHEKRAVIAISGADRAIFLQGLVTNDVTAIGQNNAVWSALLTPQGRWLSEFYLFAVDERILMDCADKHAAMLVKRLSRFRLRSDVQISRTDLSVETGASTAPLPDHVVISAADPRCEGAGWRAIVSAQSGTSESDEAYLARRLALGLPDHGDFVEEQTLALEANMDLLHGVSWTKGCYMGQELTARTHYRGLLKKRLLPVFLPDATFTADVSTIMAGEKEIGEVRTRLGQRALAVLRREAWTSDALTYNGHPVTIDWPQWFPLEMRS